MNFFLQNQPTGLDTPNAEAFRVAVELKHTRLIQQGILKKWKLF
jgi:hypothetical protein